MGIWQTWRNGSVDARDYGDMLLQWEFPESDGERPSRWWYLFTGIVFCALLAYAIYTLNYLFAVIIALCGFLVLMQVFKPIATVTAAVYESGLAIDGKFYPYQNVDTFTILYDPPRTKVLYLEFKSDFKAPLGIPLAEVNPLKLRETLLAYLHEDLTREDDDLGDVLGKVLKMK